MPDLAHAPAATHDADAGVAECRRTLVWRALSVAILSRLFIFTIGYLTRSRLPVLHVHEKILASPALLYRGSLGSLFNGWANMDAGWYLSIAQHGYAHRYSEAFFPLYPLLVRLVVGIDIVGYLPGGIALSLACFIAAVMLLYKLTADLLGERLAFWTVTFLSIAPTSFFFQAIYTESLFLLLSVALFFFSQRRRWLLAGLMGLLATLTRSTGVVLAVPLVLFYLQSIDWQWRRIRIGMASVLLVPCGLFLYMAYLWHARDDPLLFAHVESQWHRYLAPPYITVWRGASYGYLGVNKLVTQDRLLHLSTYLWLPNSGIGELTNLVALVVVVGVMALGWRRLGGAYNAYAVIALAFVLSNPVAGQPLASLPRYALVVFPLFMAVAACTERRPLVRAVLVGLCLVGLAWLTARFVLFAWVA